MYLTREVLSNKWSSSSQTPAPECWRRWKPACFQGLFLFCRRFVCHYGVAARNRVGAGGASGCPPFSWPQTLKAKEAGRELAGSTSSKNHWICLWSVDDQRWGNWTIRPSCLSLRSTSVCGGPQRRGCGPWVTQGMWRRGTFWWIPLSPSSLHAPGGQDKPGFWFPNL